MESNGDLNSGLGTTATSSSKDFDMNATHGTLTKGPIGQCTCSNELLTIKPICSKVWMENSLDEKFRRQDVYLSHRGPRAVAAHLIVLLLYLHPDTTRILYMKIWEVQQSHKVIY